MFDTILFCEKPTSLSRMAMALSSRYNPATTLVVFARYLGPTRFDYPRGRALAEYPLISEPRYRGDPNFFNSAGPLSGFMPGQARVELPVEEVWSHLRSVDNWVYMADPDSAGLRAFWFTLKLVKGVTSGCFPAHYLPSLAPADVQKALDNPTTTDTLAQLRDYGEAKWYFHWNWNVNAQAVFGLALKAAGVARNELGLSKFGLQLLYWLQTEEEKGPLSSKAVHLKMAEWTGTGKYRASRHFGSTTSRAAIFDQLKALELIKFSNADVHITDKGHRFLGLLHPGCKDQDLPARLDGWFSQGLVNSKSAMDRYLRTVFGRQLAYFQRNRLRA